MCVRLVTQLEWDNMPPRDPPQPHMDDQTSLYLRVASTEAVSWTREKLLDTIGMTKELRAEAQQILFLHDLVDVYGHLTDKGNFVSSLDCETEHGCLLWLAREYNVLPDAITIFTILGRNPTFVSNEFKKLLPHPDGDLHTMLNAWNAASWLQQLTLGMDTESATRIWGKYNLSQRQFDEDLLQRSVRNNLLFLSNNWNQIRQWTRMPCLGFLCPYSELLKHHC